MTRSIRTKIFGLVAALMLSMALVGPAVAADDDVTVTATNAVALTLVLTNPEVEFGTVTFNGEGATLTNKETTFTGLLPTSTAYISPTKVTAQIISNAPTSFSVGASSTGNIPLGNFRTFDGSGAEPDASAFGTGTPLATGPAVDPIGIPNTGFTRSAYFGVQVFATDTPDGAGGTTVTVTVGASNLP